MICKKLFLWFLFFCKSFSFFNSMCDELSRTVLPEQHLFTNHILKYPLSSNALKILKISTRQILKEIKKINCTIQEIQDCKKIKTHCPIDSLTKLNKDYAKDLNKKINEFAQGIIHKLQASNITFENYKEFYTILHMVSTYKKELICYSSICEQLNSLKEQLLTFLKTSLNQSQINPTTHKSLKNTLDLTEKINFCINYDELMQKLANFQ